jgi:hypothetical protein
MSLRRTLALGVTCAAVVAGCGGGQHFANDPRPPTPVDLTVYISNSRVSVSPSHIGAGPVIFYVTNQSGRTESLTVGPVGAGGTLGYTGPINPGSPAQLQVNLASSGHYRVQASAKVAPATLDVGKQRASSDNVLLQP